jgi:hypothetical protein
MVDDLEKLLVRVLVVLVCVVMAEVTGVRGGDPESLCGNECLRMGGSLVSDAMLQTKP